MNIAIVKDGVIINVITAKDNSDPSDFGGVNLPDGKWIGDPIQDFTPSQLREEAYNTQAIISWDGSMLTVTQAAQQWQYYAAEGATAKTDALTALIAEAKSSIREQYPDENEA